MDLTAKTSAGAWALIIMFVLIALFSGLIGYWLAPSSLDVSGIELERKQFKDKELRLKSDADSMAQVAIEIEEQRHDDSIFYIKKIIQKETTIKGLKDKINEFSLKNATANDLDSIRIMLYRAKRK